MKYSYEFKKECVRLHRLGEWADIPKGIGDKQFRNMIMIWHRLEDLHGPEVLKHNSSRAWTAYATRLREYLNPKSQKEIHSIMLP